MAATVLLVPGLSVRRLPGLVDRFQWSAHVARCLSPKTAACKLEKVVAMYILVIVRTRLEAAKDKGRTARLESRAQALWSVALDSQKDRELRAACRFRAAVGALETAFGNDLPRSATSKCFALLELIRLWQHLSRKSDVKFSLRIASDGIL